MSTEIPRDLRGTLASLDAVNGLVHVQRPVAIDGELTAVLNQMEILGISSAALFESLVGFNGWSIAASIFSNRRNLATILGTTPEDMIEVLDKRISNPVNPQIVSEGPVQDNILLGDDVDLDRIPLVTHHGGDVAPYISLGLTFVKDPDTGVRNVGIYRYMRRDNTSLVPSLTSLSNIADIFRRQEQRGEPLDIAIVPSASPALIVAASFRAPLGIDECALAGGIQGQPLELVPAQTVDLEVPADAELVLEGQLLPGERFSEAPFADMSRSYSRIKQGPLAQITAITHRAKPILQIAFSGHPDTTNMAAIATEVAIWKTVRSASPNVVAVHVPASGFGLHCYISIRKSRTVEGSERGEQRNVMLAALGAVPQIKLIAIFDHDVDIFDDGSVLGALARRFQAVDVRTGEERFLVIPNTKGATYDPSSFHREYPNTKMMIDATLSSNLSDEERSAFDEAKPGWEDSIDLNDYIN